MLGLLCMLLAGQLDGGSPGDAPIVILDVAYGDLVVREEVDGGVELVPREVDDGCYLPTESCIRVGKQKARKEAELRESNEQGAKWVAVAFGSGTAVGVAIGMVIGIFMSGKTK